MPEAAEKMGKSLNTYSSGVGGRLQQGRGPPSIMPREFTDASSWIVSRYHASKSQSLTSSTLLSAPVPALAPDGGRAKVKGKGKQKVKLGKIKVVRKGRGSSAEGTQLLLLADPPQADQSQLQLAEHQHHHQQQQQQYKPRKQSGGKILGLLQREVEHLEVRAKACLLVQVVTGFCTKL